MSTLRFLLSDDRGVLAVLPGGSGTATREGGKGGGGGRTSCGGGKGGGGGRTACSPLPLTPGTLNVSTGSPATVLQGIGARGADVAGWSAAVLPGRTSAGADRREHPEGAAAAE